MENIFNYNDYELLYLYNMGSEEARKILFAKYSYLIKKKISNFNIKSRCEISDFEQEGIITLHKALKIYKETSKMSFTRFFEMLLEHRYIDLKRQKKRDHIICVDYDTIDYIIPEAESFMVNETVNINYNFLSELEKNIYILMYEQGFSNRDVCEKLNLDIKQVYAAKTRIKRKIVNQ